MDLITQYALGDDIAVLLIVLAVAALAAVVAGLLVPSRIARGDDDRVDAALGGRLGAFLGHAGSIALWVGIPLVALSWLVPGSTDDRLLRGGMLLAGILLGLFAAWRGMMILLPGLEHPAEAARDRSGRLSVLAVLSTLGTAILPITVLVRFLPEASGMALLGLAVGTAVPALALRLVSVPVEAVGASAHLLVDVDEQELPADDEDTLGAPLERAARVFRGGAMSADLLAVVCLLSAAGVLVGLEILGAEAVLLVLLALLTLLVAAALPLLLTRIGASGRENTALQLGGLLSSVIGGALLAASAILWLPSRYADLRFAQAGQGDFTDPAVAGPEPLPRADMVEQIENAAQDLGQWVAATDDSRDAGAFLDTIVLYTVDPAAAIGTALVLGALIGLATMAVCGVLARRQGGSARRAARTSRTGGALGAASAAGSAALSAAGALAALILAGLVLSVLSAGIPQLALTLLAHAGLAALVVACGQAMLLLDPTGAVRTVTVQKDAAEHREADRARQERHDIVAAGSLAPRAILLIAGLAGALALMHPVVSLLQRAARAETVWEDRALHALTPMSLSLLGGLLLGAVTVLLIAASLLDLVRRAGAATVVEARAVHVAGADAIGIGGILAGFRRGALTPMLVAAAMPLVAGFGLGPAALPGFAAATAICAVTLGLWALLTAETSQASLEAIGQGRYGGPGSWGHSGALTAAVLSGLLRSVHAGTAVPLAGLSVGLAALSAPAAVQMTASPEVDPALRWGVAVVALLIAGTSWAVSATAPEVDLEDEHEELSRPLFARREQEHRESTLEAMTWGEDDEDTTEVDVELPQGAGTARGSSSSGRARKGAKEGSRSKRSGSSKKS